MNVATPRFSSERSPGIWTRHTSVVVLMFLFAAAFSVAAILEFERQRFAATRADVLKMAALYADSMQRRIEADLFSAYALAALIRQNHGDLTHFASFSQELLDFFPDILVINAAPDGVISHVMPANKRSILGIDLLKDPIRSRAAMRARDTGKMVLTGPFDLKLGGRGVVGRLPVYLKSEDGSKIFWGFSSVAIRFADMLGPDWLGPLVRKGYALRLWRRDPVEGRGMDIAQHVPELLHDPVEWRFQIADATWRLTVAPRAGWLQPEIIALEVFVGLLFSLLIAVLTKLLLDARTQARRLEDEVERRTEEIRAREADLNRAEEVAGLGSWIFDLNENCTRASPQARLMCGLAADARLDFAAFAACIDAEDRPAFDATWQRVLQGETCEMEYRLGAGTRSRWCNQLARPMLGAGDTLEQVVVTLQDITEKKRAQQAYAAVLEKYKVLFEIFPLGVMVVDAHRQIVESNAAARRLLKLSSTSEPVALASLGWRIVRTDGSEMPSENFAAARALRGQQTGQRAELGILRPDGETVWLSVTAMPVSWAPGGVLVVLNEIGERLRAEQELRIAATVFDAQMGMSVTDADGIILRANRAFVQLSGFSAEELIGRNPRILQSGRQDRAFYESMWEAVSRTGNWSGEVWNRRKSGELYPEWLTITAVKDQAGRVTHYVGTHDDITERKAAEERIRDLAYYDPLTHLPNRRLFFDRLERILANMARRSHFGALLFVDLDRFKELNDTLGHNAGDLMLQGLASRMQKCLRVGDSVSRLGGDEFVVLLPDLGAERPLAVKAAGVVGEKMRATMDTPFDLDGVPYTMTASIGVILFGGVVETVEELLHRADSAMYRAKQGGRDRVCFDDEDGATPGA